MCFSFVPVTCVANKRLCCAQAPDTFIKGIARVASPKFKISATMWAAVATVCLALALSGVSADYTGDGEQLKRFAGSCMPGTAHQLPV